MANFLFVVDKFFPDVSAGTICCNNILEVMQSLGHNVDILTIKRNYQDEDVCVFDGSMVFRLNTYHHEWTKKLKKSKWEDINVVLRKLIGLTNKIKAKFNPLALNGYLDTVNVNKLYKTIKQNIDAPYDAMLTFTEPFAIMPICKKLMQKGIAKKWCTFMLDDFIYNNFHKDIPFAKREKIANSVFKLNSKIFIVDGVLVEATKEGYVAEYKDKLIDIHQPMLTAKNQGNEPFGDGVNLVYAGLFYADIRRPNEMLDVLKDLPVGYNIHLYGNGCEDIVQEKSKLFTNSKLLIHGRVPYGESIQAISNANILVNLSNKDTYQIPSKILEYVGFGKPIINFYFSEDDICLNIFKNYPVCYNLNVTNYTQADVDGLIEFCKKHTNTLLSYKEATKNLQEYTIEYITNKVLKELI